MLVGLSDLLPVRDAGPEAGPTSQQRDHADGDVGQRGAGQARRWRR